MRYRILAVLPIACALLFGLALLVAGPDGHAIVARAGNEMGKVLGVIGCLAAALAFEPGEYLRRAWILLGMCLVLLLGRDALLLVDGAQGPGPIESLRVALSFFANLSAVIGTLMIARAWSVAGMALPGPVGARAVAFGAALAVAVALGGASAYLNLTASLQGDARAMIGLASDVGDILSTTLIAPLLLTAIAVRGGLLRWPWGLLTASLFAWLLYNLFTTVLGEVPVHGPTFKLFGEGFRVLACMFQFSAGFAQRFIVRSPPAS